jgi:hypothetical protein
MISFSAWADRREYREILSDHGSALACAAADLALAATGCPAFQVHGLPNSNRFVGDSKMHEMVAVAMEENWDVCKSHIECVIGIIAAVISDGVVSGEFHTSDVGVAALCTLTAVVRFVHPQLIAEFADKPSPTLDQMIDFVIAGLSAPANQPVS